MRREAPAGCGPFRVPAEGRRGFPRGKQQDLNCYEDIKSNMTEATDMTLVDTVPPQERETDSRKITSYWVDKVSSP